LASSSLFCVKALGHFLPGASINRGRVHPFRWESHQIVAVEIVHASRQGPNRNLALDRALNNLKQAEVDLLAAIHPGGHPQNDLLLEAHASLWEAFSTLSKAASVKGGQFCETVFPAPLRPTLL
jgi:hypothetical protein